jgi:hypothetical protein
MRLSFKQIAEAVRRMFRKVPAYHRFTPRSYQNPLPWLYDRLYSSWREEYTDSSGRVLDDATLGASFTGLDLYWLDKKAKRRTRRLIVAICILVVTIGVIALWVISLNSPYLMRSAVRNIERLSSLAMIFLTLALVIVTWRYVHLTSGIVREMRWARSVESEPLIFMQVRRELEPNNSNDIESRYVTVVTIQNLGRGTAIGLRLLYSYYVFDEDGNLNPGGGAFGDVQSVAPGEQQIFNWGCNARLVTSYRSLGNYPFLTLKLFYRDIFDDEYTLTQDYSLFQPDKEVNWLEVIPKLVDK